MLDQFSATIEKIYAAAGDGAWSAALGSVEELTGSAGAVVHIISKRGSGGLTTLLGDSAQGYFIRDHVDEWTLDYAPLCPRLAAAARWPDAPHYVDYMLLDERGMDFDPVYDWYGSYGLRYFIGSRLFHSDDLEVVWSLQRRRDQGHVQSADVEMFERLKPHLVRAVGLASELGTLRSYRSFSAAMLEALPQAVFSLDGNGVLLFANALGSDLLARSDGLSLSGGCLMTASAAEQQAFNRLIQSVIALSAEPSSGWTRISRPSGRLPYAVFVAPLRATDKEVIAEQARVLVLVHDAADRRCIDPAVLVAVYALTDAEARLASALAGGHSIESSAAALHIRPATARTHLKHIFLKLGVNRQQDLVRLLTSLSTLARPG